MLCVIFFEFPNSFKLTKAHSPTCLESPVHSNTLGATLCRHNIVVGGVSSDPPRESDGGYFIQGGGGVPVGQI